MPTRPLTPNDNFQTVSSWLIENLSPCFTAKCSNTDVVPERKGIYCFFLKPAGYTGLSRYVSVVPVTTVFKHQFGETKVDLVYLGTAGTGKQGRSHLNERLRWHLCSKHSRSAVCSGTLSTFRATLGALISTDLILPNTTDSLNKFFEENFFFGYIEYGKAHEVHINDDEKILIRTLKPLLNFRNNPNALLRAGNIPSNICRQRRQQVYNSTRSRLNC